MTLKIEALKQNFILILNAFKEKKFFKSFDFMNNLMKAIEIIASKL
jgi:hypothetical protein